MAEQKTNMTDEQLAQELRKSKGGKLGGKILSLLGGVIAVAGMILGDNLVLVVIGGVVLGLGQHFPRSLPHGHRHGGPLPQPVFQPLLLRRDSYAKEMQ